MLDRIVEGYVAISANCYNALSTQTHKRIVTIYNGIDIRRILRSEEEVRTFRRPLECVAIGHICPQKNYDLMIESLGRLKADIRAEIRLKIVGDGTKRDTDAIEQKIGSCGLTGIVELLGHRNNVPEILSGAQLLLMSSAYEGLPIALIEAAASGVPAIVTDVGGCSEIVLTGESGLVVPADDPVAFAGALNDVFMDPACIEKWSRNAMKISRTFSISNSSNAHLEMYDTAGR
jgi:glycosyltransferase involved in cell wall biosynthesis